MSDLLLKVCVIDITESAVVRSVVRACATRKIILPNESDIESMAEDE